MATVNELLIQWNASLVGRKSIETIKNYIPDNKKFFDWYKQYKNIELVTLEHMKRVVPAEVDIYVNYLKSELHNEPQTINRKISSIRAFFEFVKQGLKLIDSNIIDNVSGLIVRATKPTYCGTTQVRDIVDNIKTHYKVRDRAIILFDAHTGLRRDEIANVKISDIDFEQRQLYVIGKGSKERIIDLNDDVVEVINEWLKVRPKCDCDYLFITERKGKMSKETVYHIFKTNLSRISPKFATHTMRRTCLTTMLENGVPAVLVREIAGHKSVETTQKYFISSPELRKKAANTIKI